MIMPEPRRTRKKNATESFSGFEQRKNMFVLCTPLPFVESTLVRTIDHGVSRLKDAGNRCRPSTSKFDPSRRSRKQFVRRVVLRRMQFLQFLLSTEMFVLFEVQFFLAFGNEAQTFQFIGEEILRTRTSPIVAAVIDPPVLLSNGFIGESI